MATLLDERAAFGRDDTWWYHFINVAHSLRHRRPGVFHCAAVAGVGQGRRVARAICWPAWRRRCSCCIPAQTEAVAYMAGRSEALSVMLAFAAFTVFLYRRAARHRLEHGGCAVLLLFGAALLPRNTPSRCRRCCC